MRKDEAYAQMGGHDGEGYLGSINELWSLFDRLD